VNLLFPKSPKDVIPHDSNSIEDTKLVFIHGVMPYLSTELNNTIDFHW